jgi:hypothetical protein
MACRATERRSGTKKMPRHRLGHTGARHSLVVLGWLDRATHSLHMLAYKDLTRKRAPETRLCVFCGVPSGLLIMW